MSNYVRPGQHPGGPPDWRGNSVRYPSPSRIPHGRPPFHNRFQNFPDGPAPPFRHPGYGFDLSRPPQGLRFDSPPPAVSFVAPNPPHGFSAPPPNHFSSLQGQMAPAADPTEGMGLNMNMAQGMAYPAPLPPPPPPVNQPFTASQYYPLLPTIPPIGFPASGHQQSVIGASETLQVNEKSRINDKQMGFQEKASGSALLKGWLQKMGKTKSQPYKAPETKPPVQLHWWINGLKSMMKLLDMMSIQVKDMTNSLPLMDSASWESARSSLVTLQDDYMALEPLLQDSTVRNVEQELKKVRKKRARLKQARMNSYLEKQRQEQAWEEKSQQIDKWQERHRATIKEESQRKLRKEAADRTLSKVTREIQDATRLIETMLALQKLRLIRRDAAQKRGETELGESRQAFEQKIADMTHLVQAQLECYKEEESKLKDVIRSEQEESTKRERLKQAEKEIQKKREEDEQLQLMLFGPQNEVAEGDSLFPFTQYYTQAETNLHSFLQIRHDWDTFLVPEGTPASSTVPSSWVIPEPPNNATWAAVLK